MNEPAPDELISAYFDGEVTSEEREQAENLLETSDDLRQMLDDTAKLSALLHSFPRESAPGTLAAAVQQKVDALPASASAPGAVKRLSYRREWMAFGAGTLATMAALLLVYTTIEPPGGGDMAFGRKQAGHGLALSTSTTNRGTWYEKQQPPEAKRAYFGATKTQEFGEAEAGLPVAELKSSPMIVSNERLNEESDKLASIRVRSMKSDVTTIEPQYVNEYLNSLKDGDLVVRQVFDAEDAVAVVEFEVIDVDKAVDGIKLLLQKRDVQKVDDPDASDGLELGRDRALKRNLDEDEKLAFKQSGYDDLVVVYVRAKGDRLADAIKESLTDHPELYKSFAAQLPIELPAVVTAEPTNQPRQKRGEQLERKDAGAEIPALVCEEGKLAVNSYAISNGLVTTPLNAAPTEGRVERRGAALSKSAEGYTTFRVASDHQRNTLAQQAPAPQQRYAMAAKAGAAADAAQQSNLVPLQNSWGVQNSHLRLKSSRAVSDKPDPRLVRMLIVLKPDSNTAAP